LQSSNAKINTKTSVFNTTKTELSCGYSTSCDLILFDDCIQSTVDAASEDRQAKINDLEQHTSRMAQVIQQMESRFDACLLTYLMIVS